MLTRILIVLFAINFFSYSLCAGQSQEKQPAPEGLDNVIEKLSELEESYENGEWDKASQLAFETEKDLNDISSTLSTDDQIDFSDSIKGLHYGITKKNESLTERSYIRLTNLTFQLFDHFQHDTHPLFILVDKYINEEAVEAVERGDFDGVISEIREVANILRNFAIVFKNKGVTEEEIREFHQKLNIVVLTAKNKDAKAVDASLEETKQYLSKLSLYQ